MEGLVIQGHPNGVFEVRLDDGSIIKAYVAGRIRINYVQIVVGDRVKIEMHTTDMTKGRIACRIPNRIGIPPWKKKEKKKSLEDEEYDDFFDDLFYDDDN
nr:translation initiation factor 1 [Sciadopitys verticillata]BCK60726.1 translation initiation factor 1 [Sciadopitys verticillata]